MGARGIEPVWAALVTMAGLVAAGCVGDDAGAEASAPPPPEVTVATVSPETVPEAFEFAGEVVPYQRVEVRARVDGIILARPFVEGQVVREGQVLYELERIHHEAAYRSALARLENARRSLERLEPLLEERAVAQQEVDDAQSEMVEAQAAADQAEKDLADTSVRAGMNGRVGETLMEVGARVTGPADLLTTIERLDPVRVTFRPSSQQLLVWQKDVRSRELVQPGGGLDVEVTLPDGSTLPRVGRIDFVAPTLDAMTGTREFRALFDNPDLLLMPGQFVRVRVSGFVRENALTVPQRAVQTGMGRQFVYIVGSGDTAQARDVETGPWSGDRWIIVSGLRPCDRVIVDGLQKVVPGQPVRPAGGAGPGPLGGAGPPPPAGSAAPGSAAPPPPVPDTQSGDDAGSPAGRALHRAGAPPDSRCAPDSVGVSPDSGIVR